MNDFNKNNENRNDKDKDKEEIDMDVKSIENQIIETQEKKITDNNELLTELRIT
jgi:hypothetical protein